MRLGRSPFIQRLWLGLGLVLTLALTGCGGAGSKYNEFVPKRIIVIGDEITYVGCTVISGVCAGTDATDRYTVNFGPGRTFVNNWVVQLAANYGLAVNKIIEPSSGSSAISKLNAQAVDVLSQASNNIPSYMTGDMVVVAGGANDILSILQDGSITSTSGVTFKRGLTNTLADQIIDELQVRAISKPQAYHIMQAAQSYQDIALYLINTKGQRNVFLVPVYDFGNSPDLGIPNGFCSVCSKDQIRQSVALFNFVLRLLTDNSFQPMVFKSGDPRILLSSGNTSYDLFYVNIAYLTRYDTPAGTITAVFNYDVTPAVCGASSANNVVDLSYASLTSPGGCSWNGVFDGTASFTGDGLFVDNKGRYIYTKNQYLTPSAHVLIGNSLSFFMRGYNGW